MSSTSLRIGLIGAGGISRSHLPHLLALGGDVVVYSEEGAGELVAELGGRAVDSLDELLAHSDVVDIATPTFTHFELARQALLAGKHVISEKPMTRTPDECQELERIIATTGRRLYPAHVVRFFPAYARLKKAVEDGLLGDLAVLRFVRSGAFPTRTPWFADPALSGGIIMDQMIHDLDIARWVAGEVVTVAAVMTRAGSREEPIEAAHVLLTHASGAITHAAGLWGPAHLEFSTEYSVTGTRGNLEHASSAQRSLRADLAQKSGGGEAVPDTDPAEDPYYLEIEEFLRALGGGAEARVTSADGMAAVRIATAALDSLETGQPVQIDAKDGEAA